MSRESNALLAAIMRTDPRYRGDMRQQRAMVKSLLRRGFPLPFITRRLPLLKQALRAVRG